MKSHARVAIIGGGIFGCSLLYHLVKRGWSDVVLIEKNELTAGSTWHAAGLCTHFGLHLSVMKMRAYSVRLYLELEKETGQPTGFRQCGALRITRSEDRMDEFRHVAAMGRWVDVDYRLLGPRELEEVYPLVRTEGIIGAIWEPKDGFTDPSQTTQSLAQGARKGGAEIYRHTPVTGIARRPSGEWRVATGTGDITADIVVNAAGTWAREVGRMVGLDLPIVPMLHQYLVTDRIEAVAAHPGHLPIIRDPEESWYCRQERDGAIIGPYEKAGVPWAVDGVPPEFGMELLPPDLDRIEPIVAQAMARIPALASAGIKEIVNGPITFTPDANALIGPAHGLPDFYIMAGTSMGVMEGGGAGKYLADWIVDGEPPVDMLSFDPRRFGAFADRAYRLDKAVECFGNQFAIHFPFEERAAGRPRKKSPVYDRLAGKGAAFGARYGWERANWFAPESTEPCQALSFHRADWFETVGRECRAVAAGVGVLDASGFSKFRVSGPAAETFLDRLSANRIPRRVGGLALCHFLSPKGGVVSEFTITREGPREGEQSFYLCSAAAAERHDLDWLTGHLPASGGVAISNVSEARGVLAVAGPKSRDLLAKLTDDDLADAAFPWLTARPLRVAGVEALALRVSYTGELGWELHHSVADQPRLYDGLFEAGAGLGVADFGFYALDSLRLEKGYAGWGTELSIEGSPLEAGLDRFVKLNKGAFLGRAALLERQARGLAQRLVTLEIDAADADAFGNEPVTTPDGETVGVVTSGGYGHRVAKSLALAYVEAAQAAEGTALAVEILGDVRPARVVASPAYDPENARLRG
ncbi:MAG: FAD-dependent oxidoreductase [Kiloniellales bacterium]